MCAALAAGCFETERPRDMSVPRDFELPPADLEMGGLGGNWNRKLSYTTTDGSIPSCYGVEDSSESVQLWHVEGHASFQDRNCALGFDLSGDLLRFTGSYCRVTIGNAEWTKSDLTLSPNRQSMTGPVSYEYTDFAHAGGARCRYDGVSTLTRVP